MIDNYYLYKNLPSIDLHGCNRYEACILVNSFINDNIKLKNNLIIIVHGKGEGILRKSIHEELKKNKKVKAFRLDAFNDGCTIVEI